MRFACTLTGKKPHSQALVVPVAASASKNGYEDESGRQKGGSTKRKFFVLSEKEHALNLMVNKNLKAV